MNEAGDEGIAAVLAEHSIIGAQTPRQGAGQTLPELHVLCLTCGWMSSSSYSDHLAPLIRATEGD